MNVDSIKSNFKFELVARIIAAVTSGATIVFLARSLEPENYGILFLSISIFTIVGFFAQLGISKSASRYISDYLVEDESQIPHIIKLSTVFLALLVGCSVIGVVLFRYRAAAVMGEPELAFFLLIGTLYIAGFAIKRHTRIILQGFQSIQFSAFIHSVEGVSRLLFVVLFVTVGFGAIGALLGYILSFGLAAIIGTIIIISFYRKYDRSTTPDSDLAKRIFQYSIPIAVTRSASKLDKEVDTLLVGFFLSPLAVSYYAISKQIIRFTEIPASALGFTISPIYGENQSLNELEESARVFETTLVNTLLLYLPACAGLIIISKPTVTYIFGPEYTEAATVLQVMAVYMVLQAIGYITNGGLDFLGKASVRAKIRGSTAILNVVLNIIFIPTFGVIGAAFVTVFTFSLYTIAVLFIMYSEFPVDLVRLAANSSRALIITILMTVPVYVSSLYITGVVTLLGTVAIGAGSWLILSASFGMIGINMDGSILDIVK
ncbi:flippase [Natronoglomus mannanivorans]|uniref:Flippase n=1 Tax=Natronoglomus mannanivorans TaxID=2979990 RepID=A0AAP3E3Z7_9EURY|nr:flippase [Halobacteria archaeon AArc-xg1-1]